MMTRSPLLSSRLAAYAKQRGDAVAFRFLGRRPENRDDLTWSQLWGAACERAGRLTEFRGQPIGILCPEPREFVVSLAATFVAGATAVPMPAVLSRRSAPRVQSILGTAELAAVIASPSGLKALSGSPSTHRIRLVSTEAGDDARARLEVQPIDDLSEPLLVQFTSGSTGSPKGILLSHANVAENCEAIARAYGLSRISIGLSWLPLHHDMGLVGHVLTPMWVGGRSCIMDPLLFLQKPLRWLEAISRERATITSAPNFAYELCSRSSDEDIVARPDLSSLAAAVCGGEPVIPETLERFAKRFGPYGLKAASLAPSYGLAEATLLVTSGKRADGPMFRLLEGANPSDAGKRYTNLGPPVAGLEIRITDTATGTPVPEGTIGEVELSGISVGRPIGSPNTRWVKTGDLGFLSDGQLCVTGRIKELLILRGQNVFPADIEASVVHASTMVMPGGVAAVGIDRGGTQALAVIAEAKTSGMTEPEIEELRRHLSKTIAAASGHVPAIIEFMAPGSLPRTTSGKLMRGKIAELIEDGRPETTRIEAASDKSTVRIHDSRAPVGSLDITDRSFAERIVSGFSVLRKQGPITWQHAARGFLLTKFDDTANALKNKNLGEPDDPNSWRSVDAKLSNALGPSLRLFSYMPFAHEGERHKQLRLTLARAIAPFNGAEAVFTRNVEKRLAAARKEGGFDLMKQFAGELMFGIVCDLMGMPQSARDDIRAIAHLSWAMDPALPVRDRKEITALNEVGLRHLIEHTDRIIRIPGETLLHHIHRALPEHEPDKLAATAHLAAVILVMGNDATAGSIGFAARHLLGVGSSQVPQREWESISDDAIRYSSSVRFLNRVVLEELTIAGCPFRRGERIIVSPAAANHDPAVFGPDPNLIRRNDRLGPGLAFGGGPHLCVGARISRNVVKSAFKGLAALPQLKLSDEGAPSRGMVIRTLKSLPIEIQG